MGFADTPAPHGATKINFREQKPYVFQPYPSTRYHPDGTSVIVKDEEQDAALGPPWRNSPYPQEPKPAPPPELTLAELKTANEDLAKENADLKRENEDMKAYCAERMAEIQELRSPKKS